MVGNQETVDGDFTNYTTLVQIPNRLPEHNRWYYIGIDTTTDYRYLGIQKVGTGENMLEVAEVQVFA